MADRHRGKAVSRRQLKQPRSCREDGGELLAPGTSFVRHVRPWSVYSLLPPAAVSMDTELLQQPQRGLRHQPMHPFTSHEPRAQPGPRHARWLPVAAAAALGCFAPDLAPPRLLCCHRLPHSSHNAQGRAVLMPWQFSCPTHHSSHVSAALLARGSVSCTCVVQEGQGCCHGARQSE